jgi:hypothetical protein
VARLVALGEAAIAAAGNTQASNRKRFSVVMRTLPETDAWILTKILRRVPMARIYHR